MHWVNRAAPSKVLPSGADLAATLSPQSYAKHEFISPQNRHDGKHPNGTIKNVTVLLNNTQDPTHRMAMYSGTREFIKYKSRNKTYIGDEQLLSMELWI
jgi:hypothetical protein